MNIFRSIYIFLKALLRLAFVIVNNIYCIPTYCIWMLLILPLKKYHPALYWRIEGFFFHWLLSMVTLWSWSAGYHIVEMGDDIRHCLEDRTLVLVNHQSTGDVPMMMATLNPKPKVLPSVMWIMDYVFKFTNFGIVSVVHEDHFILSGKSQRDQGILLLRKHLRESYLPLKRKLMVLFPEGGFLRKRKETSQRYAIKNNLPHLEHVTIPRMGAIRAIMDELATHKEESEQPTANNNKFGSDFEYRVLLSDPNEDVLSWILDITIGYPGGRPIDLSHIIFGHRDPCQTFLYYRLYHLSEVPKEEEAFSKWLLDRWVEKETMLEQFYTSGEFPQKSSAYLIPPRPVTQNNLRFLLLHLFFMLSSYVHYIIISFIISKING
ncbi:acyl-CoA:lysophosphatidylglycerol acyltransferase 1 isoform X2 [Bemisia tabaci]|uniref:acyl-CoA:lysophosphatidylglycerol acyltransferase 1 isoform X2 n=1 Tax=Bemisia tabaci TaxID=7038 RepID=UPI0008F9A745|nr:PREDICTED: acyl-CoA:lysophosphatidylglycerol acyltransferase 1-like isoform X2 [Bemisia tabaci]